MFLIFQLAQAECYGTGNIICVNGYISGGIAYLSMDIPETQGYGAIGFGSSMSNADVLTVENYMGNITVNTRRSSGRFLPPIVSGTGVVKLNPYFSNGRTIVNLTVPLTPQGPFMVGVSEGVNNIIWAFGDLNSNGLILQHATGSGTHSRANTLTLLSVDSATTTMDLASNFDLWRTVTTDAALSLDSPTKTDFTAPLTSSNPLEYFNTTSTSSLNLVPTFILSPVTTNSTLAMTTSTASKGSNLPSASTLSSFNLPPVTSSAPTIGNPQRTTSNPPSMSSTPSINSNLPLSSAQLSMSLNPVSTTLNPPLSASPRSPMSNSSSFTNSPLMSSAPSRGPSSISAPPPSSPLPTFIITSWTTASDGNLPQTNGSPLTSGSRPFAKSTWTTTITKFKNATQHREATTIKEKYIDELINSLKSSKLSLPTTVSGAEKMTMKLVSLLLSLLL